MHDLARIVLRGEDIRRPFIPMEKRMKTRLHPNLLIVCSSLVVGHTAGCASAGGLTRSDVLRQYALVAELDAGVADARARDSKILAPQHLETTVATLNDAVAAAQRAEKRQANAIAEKGLNELKGLNEAVVRSGKLMEEVMSTRARAVEQGSMGLFESDFKRADDALRQATRLIEKNQHNLAADRRSSLIKLYADLELRALKEGLAAAAVDAIEKARAADAGNYATKTFEEARQELKLVTSVVEADRTRVEKSNTHAKRAIWLARRAHEITTTAKWFERQRFTAEDVLLWYQGQLQRVRQPVTTRSLPFDRPNSDVVTALRWELEALVLAAEDLRKANRLGQQRLQASEMQLENTALQHNAELQRLLAAHESELAALRSGRRKEIQQAEKSASKQVAELQHRLSSETLEREQADRREKAARARYEHVSALFDPRDAAIFRQGDDILIRLKGFQFRPGGSYIESHNFALLNNIVTAANIFPNGRIKISGHTDATGGAERNLALSKARANGVARFLRTVGGISSERLISEGRGDQDPIASNQTSDGRAANRRIDVWVVN
jgi:outer membrane protein OmpA-like peptidoglycan-associated protein